jgi:urea-proton symporter
MGSLFCVGVFPVWEGRYALASTLKSIYPDVTGKQHPGKFHRLEAMYVEGMGTGNETPSWGRENAIDDKGDSKGL